MKDDLLDNAADFKLLKLVNPPKPFIRHSFCDGGWRRRMAYIHRKIVLFFLGLTLLGGCIKSPLVKTPNTPPNVAIFHKSYEEVWKTVINTITLKHLLPLEINDPKQGTFATKKMMEENTTLPSRYRLTGTVLPTPEGIAVTLYNQQEVYEDGRWRVLQSSYTLEKILLDEIQKETR